MFPTMLIYPVALKYAKYKKKWKIGEGNYNISCALVNRNNSIYIIFYKYLISI